MKKLKAIVAGSTGFIGSALMHGLADSYDLVPLKRDAAAGHRDLVSGPLPSLPRADVLFHVAGLTLGRVDPAETTEVYRVNIQITLSLLEMCRKAGIPRIVFASSYVYGHPAYVPIDEKHPVQGITPYMHSKILCEEILKAYHQWTGIQVIALRLFNVAGNSRQKGLLIPDILNQLGQPEIVMGDPHPKRDFVYIDDVVAAFDRAAQTDVAGWEAVNIGSGKSYSVEEVARLLVSVTHSTTQLRFDRPARPAEIANVVADISKAKRLLGWTPKVTIEEGLRRIAARHANALKQHAQL